jgi:hypothetical protein
MAVKTFSIPGDLFDKYQNQNATLIYGDVFAAKANPEVGDILYSNASLTSKLDPLPKYGLIQNGQLYEITLDYFSAIVEKRLYAAIGSPALESDIFQPQQDVTYDTAGNIATIRTNWQLNRVGNQVFLKDLNWATGFDTGATRHAYITAEPAAAAAARSFNNLDVTDMEGFDIAPLILYQNQKYSQSYIHIKANPNKNRRKLQLGNKTYYWMPPEHEFVDSLLPNYYKTFPNITVPLGKISASQHRYTDDWPLNRSLEKGINYHPDMPNDKKHVFDYDHWAHRAGMPGAYTKTTEELNSIFESLPEATLINNFINDVVSRHKNKGIVTLNMEVFVGMSLDFQKLFNIIGTFKDANPTALLAFWAQGGGAVFLNRIQLQSIANTDRITPDLKYTGTYDQWQIDRAEANLTLIGRNWYICRLYPDIFYTNNGYQTGPDVYSYLHEAMIATVMNRKWFSGKKMLWTNFHLIEYQVDAKPVDFFEYKSIARNEVVKLWAKPLVSPGELFSRELFALGFADGSDMWIGPWAICDDPWYYGLKNISRDQNNNEVPGDRFLDLSDNRGGATGPDGGRSMQGLNWHRAAKWAIAQNADIINSNTIWEFLEISEDDGATWLTGDQLLLSETLFHKKPIAIFKKHSNGSVGCLLFKNQFQDPVKEVHYKVKIEGTIHDIFQIGDYASCVRIPLN